MMPPSPQGTVQEQLVRQYSYLFQMAQQLNVALGQLESGGTAAPSGGTAAPAAREQQYQTLKSMIVKTADTVQRRMDQLSAKLTGEYVAASEFGTYVERLNAYLEANPEALTQYYSFFADLQASTETVSAAFEQYRVETEGYIRTGIVCYDGAVPQYGVAVGQNLTCREVDGETVVEQNDFRATFTASKLSFWQDASEVAYVSKQPAVYHQHHGAGGYEHRGVGDLVRERTGDPVDGRLRKWPVFTEGPPATAGS